MNKIREELRACLETTNVDGSQLQASFHIPDSFSAFEGHFPGDPILPGICVIQAALCLLSDWKKRPARLEEIVSAKFFRVVKPDTKIDVTCRGLNENEECSDIRVEVSSSEKEMAELRLKVIYAEEKIE